MSLEDPLSTDLAKATSQYNQGNREVCFGQGDTGKWNCYQLMKSSGVQSYYIDPLPPSGTRVIKYHCMVCACKYLLLQSVEQGGEGGGGLPGRWGVEWGFSHGRPERRGQLSRNARQPGMAR